VDWELAVDRWLRRRRSAHDLALPYGTETLELVSKLKPLYANAYSEPPYAMSDEDIGQLEIRIRKHAGLDGLSWSLQISTVASLGSRTDSASRRDNGGPASRPTRLLPMLPQALISR
jgi:hypothetical protein